MCVYSLIHVILTVVAEELQCSNDTRRGDATFMDQIVREIMIIAVCLCDTVYLSKVSVR